MGPASAALEPEATGPYGVEVLEEPIVLRNGESLVDRTFVLSRAFRGDSWNAIVLVEGNGVRIRNVRILGADRWVPRWNDLSPRAQSLPGVFGNTNGIRIENVRDVAVERVSIEGLPRAGIAGHGITGGLFRDIAIRHCFVGINLKQYAPNERITFERVRVFDSWAASGEPSRERPGGFSGGDGMALNSLRDSRIIDCVLGGELYGALKISNPHRVIVRGCRVSGIQVQGVAAGTEGARMVPARDVLIEDCVIDKGLSYAGATFNDNSAIQVTYHVAQCRIHRCLLNSGGQNGHGIQVTTDSHAEIVGCTIRGFNGVRGTRPAHALDVVRDSTVNADFARVNRFDDQKRIRLDRD